MKHLNKIFIAGICILVICYFFDDIKKIVNKEVPKVNKILMSNAALQMAYDEADYIYAKLAFGHFELDYKDVIEDGNGNSWHKVTYKNVKTLNDLKSNFRTHFSEKIVNEIMNRVQSPKHEWVSEFKEFNGQLYTTTGENGSIMYADETRSYIRVDDYKMIVRIELELNSELFPNGPKDKTFDFVYENLDGKKWVFTSFPFYYDESYFKEYLKNKSFR